MVHALQEAHRVIKPNGILIDLRPAPAHRILGLGQGRGWRPVGPLHEILDDDHAADAAVSQMLHDGYFRREKRAEVQLDRVMDTMEDVREWLAEFDQRRDIPPHDALLEQLERKRARLKTPAKITVRGPLRLAVLRKLDVKTIRGRSGPTNHPGGKMIIAILPDTAKTESLMDSLSEADFDLKDVSVILKDAGVRKKIAPEVGPVQGILPAQMTDVLSRAELTPEESKRCSDAVANGKVVVAMKVDPKYSQAAREMFTDHSAEIVKE